MQVQVTVQVSAGEELTLGYLAPLTQGIRARLKAIKKNWFFPCSCER